MEAYNQFKALYQQGRYAEAETYARKATAIGDKAFGPDHPTSATLFNNLAVLYWAQDRYAEAEPLYQRSLAIWEKALGPEHTEVAKGLENYAALLRKTGRTDEANHFDALAKAIRAKH